MQNGSVNNINKKTSILRYDELLDLMIYNLYKTWTKSMNVSYPLVNICVLIIQTEGKSSRKILCERFLAYAFKFYMKKNVYKNIERINKYFNTSINGFHMDMEDVYQELYIHFFELVNSFDIHGDIYFVIYLRNYIFYWLSNKFNMKKKEQISQVSIDKEINEDYDIVDNSIEKEIAQNQLHIENTIEYKILNKMLMDDFDKKVMQNPKNFRSKEIHEICYKVYRMFFIENKTNRTDIANIIGISQQKVRYYLNKVIRLYRSYYDSIK
jgi:hypothetical protein